MVKLNEFFKSGKEVFENMVRSRMEPEQIVFQTKIRWYFFTVTITFTNYGIEWGGKKYLYSDIISHNYFIARDPIKAIEDSRKIQYPEGFYIIFTTQKDGQIQIRYENQRDYECTLSVLEEYLFAPIRKEIADFLWSGETILIFGRNLYKYNYNYKLYFTPRGILCEYDYVHWFQDDTPNVITFQKVFLPWADRGKTWDCSFNEWSSLDEEWVPSSWDGHAGGHYIFKALGTSLPEIYFSIEAVELNFNLIYSLVEFIWERKIKIIGLDY